MFTKALIVETPENEDNHYKVRIPIFEDTTGDEVIFDALACHAPGVFNGYNVGDCVYVAFEDAKLNIPVIIGRLYVEEQDDYSKGLFNNLAVTGRVQLPMDTTFGDGMSISNLYDTMKYLDGVADEIHKPDPTKADIDSPTFTGEPKAPTAPAGTNTTQIATTEFVDNTLWHELWPLEKSEVFYGNSSHDIDGMADYKYLRVWVNSYAICFPVYIDLTKMPNMTRSDTSGNKVYRGSNSASIYTTKGAMETHFSVIEVNEQKTTISIVTTAYYKGTTFYNRNNNVNYFVYRIEGIK